MECANCFSTNLYRAGRCQVCYRHLRRHGTDRVIAPERQMKILQREQARVVMRHLSESVRRRAQVGT